MAAKSRRTKEKGAKSRRTKKGVAAPESEHQANPCDVEELKMNTETKPADEEKAKAEEEKAKLLKLLRLTANDFQELEVAAYKIRGAKALANVKKAIEDGVILFLKNVQPVEKNRQLPEGLFVHLIAGENQEPARLCFQVGEQITEIEVPAQISERGDGIKLIRLKAGEKPKKTDDITNELAAKDVDETKDYIMKLIYELGRHGT
jgi:hypothetical protein